MLQRRIASLLLMAVGTAMIVSAVERAASAITCTPSGPNSPAVCIHAHQDPPQLPEPDPEDGPACEVNFYFWCVPVNTPICEAVSGYGYAIAGTCQFVIEEEGDPSCTDYYAPTLVLMEFHDATCMFFEGNCGCTWVIGGGTSGTSEVCDCHGN